DERRVPVDCYFVTGVSLLIVQIHFGWREIGQSLHSIILTALIWTAGHQTGPRFSIRVRRARTMMRMTKRVLAKACDKREREGISAEQVVQILKRRFHIPHIRLQNIRHEKLHAVVGRDTIRSPDVISRRQTDAITVAARAVNDLVSSL